jgi:orotidine-5'-phosphate decarboxylase
MTAPSAPIAVAIDARDIETAATWASAVAPHVSTVKVGLELYLRYGPEVVSAVRGASRLGVFLDLKLHDIPTTVEKAARVSGALGVRYLTIHAMGGPVMLRAGVEGFLEGAMAAGFERPVALAVTVLTSDNDAPEHILPKRIGLAIEAGAGGVICAGTDVQLVKQLAPRLKAVVPGTRPVGVSPHDQARVTTPHDAVAAGADLLVIGRAVTHADEPAHAAKALVDSIA